MVLMTAFVGFDAMKRGRRVVVIFEGLWSRW